MNKSPGVHNNFCTLKEIYRFSTLKEINRFRNVFLRKSQIKKKRKDIFLRVEPVHIFDSFKINVYVAIWNSSSTSLTLNDICNVNPRCKGPQIHRMLRTNARHHHSTEANYQNSAHFFLFPMF